MHTHVHVLVLAGLCVMSAAVSARPHDASAQAPAAAPAVKAPDTPAGRALTEFVESFNADTKTRQTWLETRTTLGEGAPKVAQMDAQLREKYGPMAIVRIDKASPESIAAVVRHGTSDTHGYLTIASETTAPFKIVNIGLRAATPEEIKGGGGK